MQRRARSETVARLQPAQTVAVPVWMARAGGRPLTQGVGFFATLIATLEQTGGLRLAVPVGGAMSLAATTQVAAQGMEIGAEMPMEIGAPRGLPRLGLVMKLAACIER